MSSGGVRHDFMVSDGLTPGEDRTLRFPTVDGDGADVTTFAGWAVAFYLLDNLADAAGEAIVTKTTAGGITISAPPNIDVALEPADTSGLDTRGRAYELWRTDAGNVRRLAYGNFPLIA